MLKYFTKLAMEILPSVVATILGAYIVNHYIVSRPAADVPAAVVSSTDGKKAEPKADSKSDAKPAETSTEVANIPEPGVKAKGISEKAILGKPAVESAYEKAVEKPTEGVSAPAEVRHIPLPSREKPVAKTLPAAPAPAATAPVETAAVSDEHRDAAELARAAIERLRATAGSNEAPRPQEAARTPEPPRIQEAPRTVAAAPPLIRPLPPPIMVAVPTSGAAGPGPVANSPAVNPPYTSSVRVDDPLRPIPPADIPTALPPSRPLDLHADAKTVAEDMLSAAKSMFHAVLPK
jgi:hypothetical protein